ncbi:hypothetical protein B1NLA3E_07300 [Bacillus sp. 1NLA3E]|nr:hypothetical protein B1NLA3E_07300 [Bacillus sp. 1NLA3E]
MALLKQNVDFLHNVDWSGRREDSCGSNGTGETPQALRFSAEDAHRPPRGKRSAWNGNQHASLTEPKKSGLFITNQFQFYFIEMGKSTWMSKQLLNKERLFVKYVGKLSKVWIVPKE